MRDKKDPMIHVSQIEMIVRKVLVELLSQAFELPSGALPAHNREWYSAEEAYKLLDLSSAEKLHKKRRNGILKEGVHCRTDNDNPNAKVPRWQYHISRCREALVADDAKRTPWRRTEK